MDNCRFLVKVQILPLVIGLALFGCQPNVSSSEQNNSALAVSASSFLQLKQFTTKIGEYELGIAQCTNEGCPFVVRWRVGGKVVSTVQMPIQAATQQTETEPVDLDWGADPGLQAWGTGEENNYVSTTARLVLLDSTTTGLLVTQHYGFEHLKRSHRLITLQANKLVFAWSFDESAGPTWSATSVLNQNSDNKIILYWAFPSIDHPSKPDTLSVTLLQWDTVHQKLIPKLGINAAKILAVGEFNSAIEARKHKVDCLAPYLVLSTKLVSRSPKDKRVLGKVYPLDDNKLIEAEKARLTECGIKTKTSIYEIQSQRLPYEMQ